MDLNTFGLDQAEKSITLRIDILKKVFLPMLEKAAIVVPNADVIPVLANFQIQASEAAVRVVTTNLKLFMLCATKNVEVSIPGIAFFPVKRFLEVIKECDEEIRISVANQEAEIQSGRTIWTLKLHSGIGYPALPSISDLLIKEVDKNPFLKAVQNTEYAASRTPAKSSMMMLHIEKEKIVAYDGVRLQQFALKGFPFDVDIPVDSVNDLLKLIDKSELSTIRIGEASNHLVIQAGSDMLIINKLSEKFPDIQSLVLGPALRNAHTVKVATKALIEAIKDVRVLADKESPAIALCVEEQGLSVRSLDRFGNMASTMVDLEALAARRKIVVNHKMLMEMLGVYEAPICHFQFPEKSKYLAPILLTDPESGSISILQQMSSTILDS